MDFLTRIADFWPPAAWQEVTIVVAVSGGADSVSLLCALNELRTANAPGKIIAAHFNHRLRPAADDDAKFVVELAGRLNIACEVGVARESLSGSGGDGVEAVARAARYEFLLQTAERLGARYVATAHTADDQAETILHRVLRGTGLAGLAGIPRVRRLSDAVTLIRPLLSVSRADVVQYLAGRQQTFCLDESNEDPSFTRNRIRHALLPQLAAQYNPNVREALLRLGQIADDAHSVIKSRAADLMQVAVNTNSPHAITLDCEPLRTAPPYLICEMLILLWNDQGWPQQQMGMTEWQAVANLILQADEPAPPSLNLPGNLRAVRLASTLEITRAG